MAIIRHMQHLNTAIYVQYVGDLITIIMYHQACVQAFKQSMCTEF